MQTTKTITPLFNRTYAQCTFCYAATLIAVCLTAQIAACCGCPVDQPFAYLAAAALAFLANLPCYLKIANSLNADARSKFGWQFWEIARRASRLTVAIYATSILYMTLIVCLTMPPNALITEKRRHVLFPTGLTIFAASACLMTSSALLRATPRQKPPQLRSTAIK